MEPKEFEEHLNDLETRVDRLRALYENWFRGYEKLEPQTARKDVERRLYGLRKELPRNTGLRFRYNTLFQRYTTLTSYWHRTSKQIEEGTYRLQLQRLRRKKEQDKGRGASARKRRASERPAPQSYEIDLDEQIDVKSLLDEGELDAVAQAVSGPASEPAGAKATFGKPVDRASARPVARGVLNFSGYSVPPPSPYDEEAATRTVGLPSANRAPAGPSRPLARPSAVPPPVPPGAARKVPLPPPPSAPVTPSGVRPTPGGALPGDARRSSPQAPAPAAPQGGLGEQRLRSLYDQYASARRKNNEGEVRYEALVSSIEKMLPELQKRHSGKRIDFEIVLKDGRVGLKPKAT